MSNQDKPKQLRVSFLLTTETIDGNHPVSTTRVDWIVPMETLESQNDLDFLKRCRDNLTWGIAQVLEKADFIPPHSMTKRRS